MANVPKAITDLPVASAMGDDDLLVVSQNATTSSIKGELIKGYAQNAVASQVTAAQTAANQAGQSATQAEAARQGAAAAQTAAENAQDAAETARDQSVAAAGTIGDSVEQAQTAAGQASSARDAAVSAQSAAETAKTAAETASGQAQTAATQASGSATAAQTAATQAGDAKTDAETARNEAETSASSAANSASDAESAATEAEQAKTYIENMDMEGETLPAGSSVTVTKTTSPEGNLLFVIGVPQGTQGDKGDTGETGATGPQGVNITNATVNEDGDLVITLSAGEPINAGSVVGPQGIQGEVGPTGASVDHIERTSGTGAPGTTDTYTVYLTDGQTGGTFQVYNGSNGTGSGDFMADGSVPMAGDLQMGGHAVTGMADGTDPTDGATVGQLAGKLDSPDGGTAGQVLTKTADGSAWENAPSGLPDGGTEGQMLYKAADGAVWGDKPIIYVNITGDDSSGYTANKTLSEIKDAYQKGFSIIANTPNGIIPMTSIYENYATFIEFDIDHKRTNEYLVAEDRVIYQMTAMPNFASDVSYDRYASGLRATNVQDAIDEVQENVENVLPSGGTTGQVLTKTSTGEEWSDAPSGLPENGTEGQILEKTSSGAAWVDKPESGLTQEQADGRYLQLTGGELNDNAIFQLPGDNGSLYLGGRNNVPNVGMYADSSGYITLHDNTMGNVNIRGVRSPESDYDAANKFYVDTQLSTKLTTPTGTAGQLLGFTADNTVGAVDAPESGLTQEQADARYLQLNSDAMITGDITFKYGADFDGSKITSVGTPANGSDGANKAYVDSKAPLPPVPVTLTTSGWSSNTQTVTVSGVVASETAQLITPTPAIASQSAYYEAGIMCTNQGTNSLTFTCQTVPTSNLTVYVVIQPLG